MIVIHTLLGELHQPNEEISIPDGAECIHIWDFYAIFTNGLALYHFVCTLDTPHMMIIIMMQESTGLNNIDLRAWPQCFAL